MIRNLKVLLAAALALTALGALAASSHAADEFRCTVSPCRVKLNRDGTGTTAHHVFIVENAAKTESVSFTCGALKGTGELVNGTDISLSWNRATGEDRTAYEECRVNGSPGVVWHMNDCKFTFTAGASGNAAAGTSDQAELHIECPVGETIEITTSPNQCTFDIGTQTLGGSAANGGVGYVTAGTEITLTMNLKGLVVTKRGNCTGIIESNELIGTYTTGNTLLTGETSAGVMATASFG
jgi:hypothetical protein